MGSERAQSPDGSFRMPAEFEPHAATWMAWPTRREIWGDLFREVKGDYAALARTVARLEPVRMVANPPDAAEAQELCGPTVSIVELPIDDSWTRDSGPIFLTAAGGVRLAATFRFTAWGHKYSGFEHDAALAGAIADRLGVSRITSQLALEGGAILVDGQGTLITTESCLLNPNRNPGLSKGEIDRELTRMLGVTKIIWLPGDPTETETDGHIDGIAALARPGQLLLESVADRSDPRHEILRENRRALELATDACGRRFELIPIEEVDASRAVGPRYCRSYVNFYIVNGAVIAPAYGLDSDERVAATLRTAFPQRSVVLQPIGSIAVGGGGFHCITQQEPQ